MRRWQAIPVAVLVAVAVAGTLFGRHQNTAEAGSPTAFEFYVDCDPSTGAIDNNCVFATGGARDVNVYAFNNSGAAIGLSALQFILVTDNQPSFTPIVPGVGVCVAPGVDNCNPDFNQGGFPAGWSCNPLPDPDTNTGSATVAASKLGCSTGAPVVGTFADQSFLLLGSVHYQTSDGVGNFVLGDGVDGNALYDEAFSELGSCGPVIGVPANCFGATIQIGVSAATSTPVPPTNTPTAIVTATACVICPTTTSEAFVTVTPTFTATAPGGPTTAAGTPVPGASAPAGPGTQPGGTTGGAGNQPIRLPDTGNGDSSMTAGSTALILSIALAAGFVAAAVYVGVASSFRRKSED